MLEFICDLAKKYSKNGRGSATVLSFYAVVVCEVIAAAPRVDSALVQSLLPYLVHGLAPAKKMSLEYKAASLMMLTQLSSYVTLVPSFMSGV